MNFNISAYLIYGLITIFTIVYVGKVLYQNGRYYVLQVIQDEQVGDYINNGLLAGYYLFNIGYVFLTVNSWQTIINGLQLMEILGEKTGIILLLLGLLHFINILSLRFYAAIKGIDLGIEKK